MFCPECGREVSAEDSFCVNCGCYIRPSLLQTGTSVTYTPDEQQTGTYTNPYVYQEPYVEPKRSKGPAIAMVLVVAIIIISAALVLPMVQTSIHGSLYGKSFNSGVSLGDMANADQEFCLTAVSGFDASTATLTASGEDAVITLAESISQTYTTIDWNVKRDGDSVTPITQNGGTMTFCPQYYDTYTVTATCSDGGTPVVYNFEFRVDVYHSYGWKFDGGKFSFSISYDAAEYLTQKNDTTYHHRTVATTYGCIPNWEATTNFVVITPTIVAIESYLKDLYTKAYGSCTTDQRYADFILSFIQLNFTYELDEDQYSDNTHYKDQDYYAYPMETVYSGKGDCEDTTFLADAIYKQAGYKTAVVIIPGHAMAAVALDNYTAPNLSSGEILKAVVEGVTYYACETTVNGYQPVGASAGTYSGEYYSHYIGRYSGTIGYYGFYPVEEAAT